MRRDIVRDIFLYLAAAALLGTAANFVPGRQLPYWGEGQLPPAEGTDFKWLDVSSAEALASSLPNVVFVDGRGAEAHAASHVPDAIELSLTDVDTALTSEVEARLRTADAVILYGDTEEADVEQLLAQVLHTRGLPPPFILIGGFPAWEQAGLPVAGGGQ